MPFFILYNKITIPVFNRYKAIMVKFNYYTIAMKKRFKNTALYIIALLGISGLLQAQEPTKGLLYEISGNGLKKPSFLFGTFHILKSGYFDEHPLVNSCFERVDNLIVEVEMKPGSMADLQDAMVT
jgi:uncharacterized protein YbaP (TraB family)